MVTINLEGGKYKATIAYTGSLGIELKKPKIGSPYFTCICREKHELSPDWVKGAVKTNPTGKLLETFTAIETARKRRELENKPAESFTEKSRYLGMARRTGGFYADKLTTSKRIHCLACGRKYDFKITLEHDQEIKDYSDWLKLLKEYPLKPTKFTLLALRRLAFKQGYETVEELIEYVNNLYHDYEQLDEMTAKIEEALKTTSAKSRFTSDWFETLRSRWTSAVEEFKRELKRHLTNRLEDIYESSYKSFPEEEAEKYP